jgi:hypothetical protein
MIHGEVSMRPNVRLNVRSTATAILLGAALIGTSVGTSPAMAAWHGYISHPLGFAFAAPGELKIEKGTYRGAVAGERATLVYRFLDDNIEYKAVVVDMADKDNKKLLMDSFGRVDRQYGRKLTIDLPNNGGRSSAAFYFVNGRIISLQATVLPQNGDYDTAQMARFVDSLTFFTVRAADDAIELPAPK